MNYKFLIEKEKDHKTFQEKVKLFLKVNQTYFKASLLTEDGEDIECVIGFGFNCTMTDFKADVERWLEEEVECGTALIFTKKLCADGKSSLLATMEI